MALSHKEVIEQLNRMKAIRSAAPTTPGKASDYGPLKLDDQSVDTGLLEKSMSQTGVRSQEATQFASVMAANEQKFQQMVQAQKRLEQAQKMFDRAQNMKQLQANYSGGGVPLNSGNRVGKVPASRGPWSDPTPLNLGAGLKTFKSPYGNITVNASVGDNFVNFLRALNRTGYKVTSIGSYANRNIAGTNTKSLHAYGLAVDLNPAQNPVTYGKVITNLPKGIGRLAAKYGLAWGGNWNGSKKDPMHFSVPAYGTK